MNRREALYQFDAEIKENLPSLGAWQAVGLGLLVLGLVSEGRGHLSKIAEGIPEGGSYNTVRQRVKRWVSNPQLDVVAVCYAWIAWMWRVYGGTRAVLLVDETKLGDRFGVMMVSLAYAGRAIPLLWRCYYANRAADYPQQGQVLLIYGLLAHGLTARPLVQMDGGLAHSSAMLKALKALKVDFLVRDKQTARFTSRDRHSWLIKQWVKPGDAFSVRGTLFGRTHALTGTLCLIWEAGQDEPWCLFTNVPRLIGHRYALRWWQEESFKDLKSGGWQGQAARLCCPRRMERRILVMALAYAWCISLGTLVWSQPPRRRAETATPDELARLRLFRLGWRFLKRVFAAVASLDRVFFALPQPALFRRI